MNRGPTEPRPLTDAPPGLRGSSRTKH